MSEECPFKFDYKSHYIEEMKYKGCKLQYGGASVWGMCIGEDKCPIMKK